MRDYARTQPERDAVVRLAEVNHGLYGGGARGRNLHSHKRYIMAAYDLPFCGSASSRRLDFARLFTFCSRFLLQTSLRFKGVKAWSQRMQYSTGMHVVAVRYVAIRV